MDAVVITLEQNYLLSTCIEGFLFGIYSGIFALYLRCQSNESNGRMTPIVFYAICLLYILSTVTFISDFVALIIETRIGASISSIGTVQGVVSGCCDFLAQCILIYRCWIVWDQNIRVIIIPLFLAVAYLATWVVPTLSPSWIPLTTTSFAATMAVNALVTGLIAFRILKVFSELKATTTTSVERTLGSTSHGGTKSQHIVFIIIESGMMLLVVQLVRLVLEVIVAPNQFATPGPVDFAFNYMDGVGQICIGLTPTFIFVRIVLGMSFVKNGEESFKEAVGSLYFNHNSPSDSDIREGSSSYNFEVRPDTAQEAS